MSGITIHHGDCREVVPTLEPVDAVVTDPPYGLSFMGKGWDHGVPGVEFWEAIGGAMKPGAHLLAFGGTRTHHRLMVAIEDAGFEIRDVIMWVFGSGFPKSLDVSKAIDRAAGAEREVVGFDASKARPNAQHDGRAPAGLQSRPENSQDGYRDNGATTTAPTTDAARKWDGWGTALKPAVEYIVCARKPLDMQGHCGILARRIGESICLLASLARGASGSSSSSPNGSGEASDSAQWSAVERCNTLGDLFDLMATWPSESEMPTSLSTGLSWLRTLAALSQAANTFTTEMRTGLTTDLAILNSSPSAITPDSITGAAIDRPGTERAADLAASTFSVVRAKLATILARSAPGFATSQDGEPELRPDWRPIIVARKKFAGTVAANVLEFGTGAIDIDGCRVGTDDDLNGGAYAADGDRSISPSLSPTGMNVPGKTAGVEFSAPTGRWPANLIHDGSDEVLALFPETTSGSRKAGEYGIAAGSGRFGEFGTGPMPGIDGSSGSAARFFYTAKASGNDRGNLDAYEMPLFGETLPEFRNTHPTVKPIALMEYLLKLVVPPGGVVLDPFMGSGSTLVAAQAHGCRAIGIDLEEEYCDIARERLWA